MANDVATKAMPDFRQPAFRDTTALLFAKNIDLAGTFLMTITAMTLGMKCEFKRVYVQTEGVPKPIAHQQKVPTYFQVTSGSQTDTFHGSLSRAKVNAKASVLMQSKIHSRRAMHAAGIQTAFGGLAWADNLSILDKMAEAKISRMLVKPNKGSLGKGIVADISGDEARAHILAHPDQAFVVEQYLVGTEFRMFTVGGKYAWCYARMPDHILGDGKSTISTLLRRRLRMQATNPACASVERTYAPREKILRDAGYDMGAVPAAGKVLSISNSKIPSGRDGYYVPTGVSDQVKQLAADVAGCFDIGFCAMDIINTKNEGAFVLEANSKPSITPSCFPLNAPWNLELPEIILRHSFPNHKDHVRQITSYDFMRLINDYVAKPEKRTFDPADYTTFAS